MFSKASTPERMIKVWHQFMGYTIQPTRRRATIAIMRGPGNDGKTKLVETIRKLLGSAAVCSGDVASLELNKFGIGGLVGKLLFIDDDVKAGAKLPDGVLKKISEGKEVTGERKFKEPFNFVCRALPVLLCNNVPSMADLSFGIRRRLLVLRFNRQFAEHEDDKMLFDRIWANELPGVLNRALQGWREFVTNGYGFSPSKDIQKAANELLVTANPLVAYIDDRCELEPSASTKVSVIYTDFLAWSRESGFNSTIVRNKLRQQLSDLGYKVKMVQGLPVAMGLKLKETKRSLGSFDD